MGPLNEDDSRIWNMMDDDDDIANESQNSWNRNLVALWIVETRKLENLKKIYKLYHVWKSLRIFDFAKAVQSTIFNSFVKCCERMKKKK